MKLAEYCLRTNRFWLRSVTMTRRWSQVDLPSQMRASTDGGEGSKCNSLPTQRGPLTKKQPEMNFVWAFCVAALVSVTSIQARQRYSSPDDYTDREDEPADNPKLIEEVLIVKEELRKLKIQVQEEFSFLKEENEKLTEQIEDLQIAELSNGPGDKANTSNIWEAAERGSVPAVIFYFKEDPNSVNKRNAGLHGYTPLMYASRKGHANIVRFLLSKGANVDAINTDGNTPLLIASFWGHSSVVKNLVNKGANLNIQNKDQGTALHAAVVRKKLEIVKLLVQKGADANLKDDAGRTPLDLAKKAGPPASAIVEFLSQIHK